MWNTMKHVGRIEMGVTSVRWEGGRGGVQGLPPRDTPNSPPPYFVLGLVVSIRFTEIVSLEY